LNELAFYFDQIKKYPVLSLDEEKYIVEKMIFYRGKNNKEDKKQYLFWRSKLINHNLRLGVFFAKKISKKFDITLLDAIGYVNEGLCKAADKYELGRGAKFSSYAEWWCIHSLNRQGLLEKDIRFTQKNYYNLTNFKYVLDQLKDEKTGFVTIDDLVKKTRLTRDKIKQYWKDIQYLEPNNVLSINAPYL
jgi:RNA polymerase primary sigma factor